MLWAVAFMVRFSPVFVQIVGLRGVLACVQNWAEWYAPNNAVRERRTCASVVPTGLSRSKLACSTLKRGADNRCASGAYSEVLQVLNLCGGTYTAALHRKLPVLAMSAVS